MTISNIKNSNGVGILKDRDGKIGSLNFLRYNLIYGFNGCGKSTISRMFQSFEAGELNGNLPSDCSFIFEFLDGTTKSAKTFNDKQSSQISVFNKDFIDRNLSWAEGTANAVVYFGEEQIEAVGKRNELKSQIEKTENKLTEAEAKKKELEKQLKTTLKNAAIAVRNIVPLPNRTYEAPAFKKDLLKWRDAEQEILSDQELKEFSQVANQPTALMKMPAIEENFLEWTQNLQPPIEQLGSCPETSTLSELQQYPELLSWFLKAAKHHRDTSSELCLLCGNVISEDRMADIASILNTSTEEYMEKLSASVDVVLIIRNEVNEIKNSIDTIQGIDPSLLSDFTHHKQTLLERLKLFEATLQNLQRLIDKKIQEPAVDIQSGDLISNVKLVEITSSCKNSIEKINDTISEHNKKVDQFDENKNEADERIRKHVVLQHREQIAEINKNLSKITTAMEEQTAASSELSSSLKEVENKLSSHGPAAEAVNEIVNAYLGHNELQLATNDEGYKIYRHGNPITSPPSEGEQTAIAISYFLSSLVAEGRKISDSIIVIDDPITSLDSNALNYACNLLLNRLSEAKQLFILTHNQACMNEFRKNWQRKTKKKDDKDPTAAFYYLETRRSQETEKRVSRLIEMPKLLSNYDSEYHFLFSSALTVLDQEEDISEQLYLSPNVVRKLLDTFLAFRAPGTHSLRQKLDQVIKQTDKEIDKNRIYGLERFAQTESHADSFDDLTQLSPIVLEEAKKAVGSLFDLMEATDPEHFELMKKQCK